MATNFPSFWRFLLKDLFGLPQGMKKLPANYKQWRMLSTQLFHNPVCPVPVTMKFLFFLMLSKNMRYLYSFWSYVYMYIVNFILISQQRIRFEILRFFIKRIRSVIALRHLLLVPRKLFAIFEYAYIFRSQCWNYFLHHECGSLILVIITLDRPRRFEYCKRNTKCIWSCEEHIWIDV